MLGSIKTKVVLDLGDDGRWVFRHGDEQVERDGLTSIKRVALRMLDLDPEAVEWIYGLRGGDAALVQMQLARRVLADARAAERSAMRDAVHALRAAGAGPTDIAAILGISRQALAKFERKTA